MLDSFLTFINHFKPALTERPTLIATSGGIDSMVLLDLFARAQLPVIVAHCNFGLRGQSSIDDETFVRSAAQAYGFSFKRITFETKKYAKEQGVSTQMAARTLRYDWFEALRLKEGLSWVATAHHLNDSLETTLLNLTRGTGIAGLKGVPVINGQVIRPLLFANRKEIEAYASQRKITWVEDRSNASLDYDRNLIRHRVVPTLQSLNPALEEGFRRSSERIRAADRLLEGFLEKWKCEVLQSIPAGFAVDYDQVWSCTEPEYQLWYLLQTFGFGYPQIPSILQASMGESGRRFYSSTHCLLADRSQYVLKAIDEENVQESLIVNRAPFQMALQSGLLELEELDIHEAFLPKKDTQYAYFDADQVEWPLLLRAWEQGDRIKPFGMGGRTKKVSDILVDLKLTMFEKEQIRVLVDVKGRLLWILGIRASEWCRLEDGARRMLVARLTPTS